MYFLQPPWASILLSLFFILLSCALPTYSLRIENSPVLSIVDLRDNVFNGKIEGELYWNKTTGVALVDKLTYSGVTFKYGPVTDFSIDISSLKAVRVQRSIEFDGRAFQDIVKTHCSLSFIYDYNISSSLQLPYGVENDVIQHAENCIERILCNFNAEDHRMGDDIHIISTTRYELARTTNQATLNSVTDFLVGTLKDGLFKGNKSLITIPKFDVTVYTITFSTSGGVIDILKYINRDQDFLFQYEGHRYTIDAALDLTGGYVELNNVSLTSKLGNFVDGQLLVNTTGASLRMKVALDYNQMPCSISAIDVVFSLPTDAVDFSILKIKIFGFEVTSVEKILNTLSLKSLTVSAITRKISGQLKDVIEGLTCEDYRDLLFRVKRNV